MGHTYRLAPVLNCTFTVITRSTKGVFICPWTWVGLTLIWAFHHLPSCTAASAKFHQPKQNWEEGGTTKFKVNLTQVSEQMNHPVSRLKFDLVFEPRILEYQLILFLKLP